MFFCGVRAYRHAVYAQTQTTQSAPKHQTVRPQHNLGMKNHWKTDWKIKWTKQDEHLEKVKQICKVCTPAERQALHSGHQGRKPDHQKRAEDLGTEHNYKNPVALIFSFLIVRVIYFSMSSSFFCPNQLHSQTCVSLIGLPKWVLIIYTLLN